jgi:hypothetical protein
MHTIHAYSIGIPLAEFFCKGETAARVVARYDSTLQLQSGDVLWAITTHDHAGAHRIVVPTLPEWPVGKVMRLRDGVVWADAEIVRWAERVWWNPCPPRRSLSETERAAATRDIARSLGERAWPDARGVWEDLAELWLSVSAALHQRDERGLRAGVNHLIGRGTGLTPTGDDVLQALLVTLQTGDEHDQQTFEVLSRMVELALSRTTPLSQQFLREALQGWAFGLLKNVLEELPDVRRETLRVLLSVGASSGMAYGFGVLLGLSYVNAEDLAGFTLSLPARSFG